jgi:protein TonB
LWAVSHVKPKSPEKEEAYVVRLVEPPPEEAPPPPPLRQARPVVPGRIPPSPKEEPPPTVMRSPGGGTLKTPPREQPKSPPPPEAKRAAPKPEEAPPLPQGKKPAAAPKEAPGKEAPTAEKPAPKEKMAQEEAARKAPEKKKEEKPPEKAPPGREWLFDPEILAKASNGPAQKSPPGQGDHAVTLSTEGFMYRGYMERLREKIEGVWVYPREAAERGVYGDLVIRFVIRKDGSLGSVKLVRTSGYDMLDRAAVKALRDAEPFWPLPDVWKEDSYTVTGHFVYSLYGIRLR